MGTHANDIFRKKYDHIEIKVKAGRNISRFVNDSILSIVYTK